MLQYCCGALLIVMVLSAEDDYVADLGDVVLKMKIREFLINLDSEVKFWLKYASVIPNQHLIFFCAQCITNIAIVQILHYET